ncbi:TPR-like protein [Pholiota conissans]|uniref:TPR-like protein n=1 Tax=Pholiota conissans TaxID=109636 RepID=A0A9P6D3I7_9AGAR|nr:TPR-like protein [Pholiota conissans]
MALPMLVGGGAECGPSNALQGLSKRYDQDRGLQQDHFGAGRAGSSREVFRSQQGNGSQDHDAARFFSANATPAPQFSPHPAFDLSSMQSSLPIHSAPQMKQAPAAASWASDFLLSQPLQGAGMSQQIPSQINMDIQVDAQSKYIPPPTAPMSQAQYHLGPSNFRMNSMPTFIPQISIQQNPIQQPVSHTKNISWDREFSAQELHMASTSPIAQEIVQEQKTHERPANEADELARTAGMLLENVKHEQNPKFQKSAFMGLMKQLRDGEVIVEGNDMVESEGRTSSRVDAKGKGRALDNVPRVLSTLLNPMHLNGISPQTQQEAVIQDQVVQEDPNDAYFRKENNDFIQYWNEPRTNQGPSSTAETRSWDALQADWDKFEATSTGIKPVSQYQFQSNNPYLLGDSSRMRNHLMHTQGRESVPENVLELEAAVQRDTNNATAWYELGVKQQENEREQHALQALQRAVELDPSHLASWLALAISFTNDNNRQGTYDAVHEWVSRNEKYQDAVREFRSPLPQGKNLSMVERYNQLIACLITMARSETTGDIDADIQIALAVLLNTNEEYEKAQDCFRTALAVRPEDWLLYNRVGATMANSGRAEEALNYYYRALELNPAYIRARFNLGISCINLRRYEEAAQHILDALVLQESDGVRDNTGSNEKRGVVSTALWDSLKTTCLHMQRADLAALCDLKDVEGFRNSFQ